MTIINPYYMSVDGHVLGTLATTIEAVRGTRALAGKRRDRIYAANRHGSLPPSHMYAEEKVLRLELTLKPWDEDAEVNNPFGPIGHLEEQKDTLFRIFGKTHELIDVRANVPAEDPDESGSVPLELQGDALVDRAVEVSGDPGTWSMLVYLAFPWPYWHELPEQSQASAGGTLDIQLAGTAPVADMRLAFAGDGICTWGDGGSILEIDGSTGAVIVDVGRRIVTQGGNLARGLLKLGSGTPRHWMEWPAGELIEMTTTIGVTATYFNARH